MMMADNASEWYWLFQVKGLGPKRLHGVHKAVAGSSLSVKALLDLDWAEFHRLLPELNKSLYDAIHEKSGQAIQLDYLRLAQQGVKVVHLGHPYWPDLLTLRMKDSAPPLLFCKGNLALLRSEGIAIVGSRQASDKGLALASQFAGELAMHGKNVISGYAKGVDTCAHLGALGKDGTTTFVLSTGIQEFSRKKSFGGVRWDGNTLAVSQFHPAEKWNARNAMQRNKIVCALSQAVIVIEAGAETDEHGRMSGTFDAGKTALELGVPLFVVEPAVLQARPPGNARLMEMGGVAIRPQDGIEFLLECITPAPIVDKQLDRQEGQLPLF